MLAVAPKFFRAGTILRWPDLSVIIFDLSSSPTLQYRDLILRFPAIFLHVSLPHSNQERRLHHLQVYNYPVRLHCPGVVLLSVCINPGEYAIPSTSFLPHMLSMVLHVYKYRPICMYI